MQGVAHPLPALGHGFVGQSYDGKGVLAAADADLHLHRPGLDADEGDGRDLSVHRSPPLARVYQHEAIVTPADRQEQIRNSTDKMGGRQYLGGMVAQASVQALLLTGKGRDPGAGFAWPTIAGKTSL